MARATSAASDPKVDLRVARALTLNAMIFFLHRTTLRVERGERLGLYATGN
jgi:hypothetical protein